MGRQAVVLWILAAVLTLTAGSAISRGLWICWQTNSDTDLQWRAVEYSAFRGGDYPDPDVEWPTPPRRPHTSVYLPYAFPMFAFFFEPGGLIQGRVLVETLSLATLVVLGIHGYRCMLFGGPALAAVGAVAGAAFVSNCFVMQASQFSILCMGLIFQQMLFLERGRGVLAGICWSLAMIKPQIALPFAMLFVLEKQWRGLVAGSTILMALSLLTCWWTEVTPIEVINHWAFGMGMKFTGDTAHGVGAFADSLGVSHRVLQVGAILLLGGLGAIVWWWVERQRYNIDLLPAAGICAVLGEVLLYHHRYDAIMLLPTVLALMVWAARRPTPVSISLTLLVAATVLSPQRVISWLPSGEMLFQLIWLLAACVLASVAVTSRRVEY